MFELEKNFRNDSVLVINMTHTLCFTYIYPYLQSLMVLTVSIFSIRIFKFNENALKSR